MVSHKQVVNLRPTIYEPIILQIILGTTLAQSFLPCVMTTVYKVFTLDLIRLVQDFLFTTYELDLPAGSL